MAADAYPNFLSWPAIIHSPGFARQTEHLSLSAFRHAYHIIVASVYFGTRVVFQCVFALPISFQILSL